jgi:hypothetical protein
MKIKTLYLVLVVEVPGVTVGGVMIKPRLYKGLAGYCPVYTNKAQARKDWPKREIRALKKASK